MPTKYTLRLQVPDVSLRLPAYSPIQHECNSKQPAAPKKAHRAEKMNGDGARYRDQRAEQRTPVIVPRNLDAAFEHAGDTADMCARLHNTKNEQTSKRRPPAGKHRGRFIKSRICRNTGWSS